MIITKKRKWYKKFLASILGKIIILSGLYAIEKRKMLSHHHVTGLFFHNPSRKVFEQSIRWLVKHNCQFLSTEKLETILRGKEAIPHRAVWITVDDGWRNNLTNILPTMKKYDIPITFFISTGPVENNGVFWFSLVRKFKKYLPPIYRKDIRKLWLIDETVRQKVVGQLQKKIPLGLTREALTIPELQHLSTLPLVTIGSHTVHHALTPNCSSDRLSLEIMGSVKKLERWTSKKIKYFAYPSGMFDGREKDILRKAGIELAATTCKRFIKKTDDLYLIPRFCINDDAYSPELRCQLVGAWGRSMNYLTSIKKYFYSISSINQHLEV